MGMASQDTSELSFEDCRVPAANRLGEEGAGFMMLMTEAAAGAAGGRVVSQAAAEQVLEDTLAYVQERKAFGKPIASSRTRSSSWPSARPRSRSGARSSTG